MKKNSSTKDTKREKQKGRRISITHNRNLETFCHFFFSKAKLKNNLHKFLHDRRASIIEPRNAKYYSRVRLNVTFHWSAFRAHFFGLLSGEINWMPFFKIILFILSLTNWSSTSSLLSVSRVHKSRESFCRWRSI